MSTKKRSETKGSEQRLLIPVDTHSGRIMLSGKRIQ